ncbi:hypothetical protein SKAU_G00237290 [Synaphobranchus kaupii]|uniref:Uncharacterized protein n=1 Tax=Synaphobranchus kaupii TaxID=118154 RepID=A0A9Q1IRU8_SYNKA|nr:hypothetical protein SKAU_G00237290 [Synaphobranchus kaupii]
MQKLELHLGRKLVWLVCNLHTRELPLRHLIVDLDGPTLDCLKSQRKEVLDLVMPTVRRSAWYAHSEAILQTLLCSEDQKERIEGVERILAIKGEGNPDSAGGLLSGPEGHLTSIVMLPALVT